MTPSKKRIIVLAVVAAVVIIAIATIAVGGNKAPSNNDKGTEDGNDDMDNSGNTRDQVANITLSGSSDEVTDRFTLQAGVAVFHLNHAGTSAFAVTLLDANGQYVEMLANEIGAFTGETLLGVKTGNIVGADPGEHYLEIEASGAWSVTIEQPRVSSGNELPQTISGSGPWASMAFDLPSGVVVFNTTHSGSGNFGVKLWADDGEYVNLIVNELGYYTGEESITVGDGLLSASPGIYWLDIDADGSWTVRITNM